VISGLHTMACRPQIKFAMGYLGYYINSDDFHNQLIPFMQGIKVTSIGRKNIANTIIRYPADIEEQQKIADFLSEYDTAIQAAKDELAKWQDMKKGLLQQMFI
ncbi:MAG: restriction endonuclease subunit S, partial [Lachnospiraceae bacterium]|nr:restriction endonuclease subunit S [Lachnospiraceae bacterium]